MSDYAKSRIAMRYWLLGKGWHVAVDAFELAQRRHTGTRKDGTTPEFAHQVQIAHYVRPFCECLLFPEETIAAAFLHDVREDHGLSDEEIRGQFDSPIADAVAAMTKEYRGERFGTEAVFARIAADPIASVVKGADRIHNQHTCHGVFGPEKVLSYLAETEEHVLPMLKAARATFSEQEPVYENLKFVLLSQAALLRATAEGK